MSWRRRNRWALVALLPALALALLASSDRVGTYYWSGGDLHDARRGAPGSWVEHRGTAVTLDGEQTFEVAVRLDGLGDAVEGWGSTTVLTVPPGARAVRVDLSLRADPTAPLRGCRLAVRDAQGTRYDYDWAAGGGAQPASPCVPPDAPGPAGGDIADPATEQVRPDEWTVAPVVLVPEGVEITEVLLWWTPPTYLALSSG